MTQKTRAAWLLERVQLDELSSELAPEAKAYLQMPEGQAAAAELQRENELLLKRLPPSAFAQEVARRDARRKKVKAVSAVTRVTFLTVPALAMVAGLWGVLRLSHGRLDSKTQGDLTSETARVGPISAGERIKGLHPQLVLYRQQAKAVQRLEPGATVRAGDVLRVFYVAAGAPQGVVLSIDGGGGVTVHWPRGAERSAALTSGAEVGLPNSYHLDAAPGFERFFFITSSQPFAVEAAVAAARSLAATPGADHAPLPLAGQLGQSSLLVRKAAVR